MTFIALQSNQPIKKDVFFVRATKQKVHRYSQNRDLTETVPNFTSN